jgi:hypothetical protein
MIVFPGCNEQNLSKISKKPIKLGKNLIKVYFPKLKCTISNNTFIIGPNLINLLISIKELFFN